ncbi:hypothetical protein PR202_gb13754 [Eleusine coracana subsp. coracana]|uniref:Uncharacterized protein n=1 Tax=Eleusine coracana subsp. coracana TaxID=191504 RepID=A0AAV5ETV7_ELECO|nr:hypothetical protein PR202_gb13754 [Eleusine coracana subsp. coracana]
MDALIIEEGGGVLFGAEDDLDLARGDAVLRRDLDVGGVGPRVRAHPLEHRRRRGPGPAGPGVARTHRRAQVHRAAQRRAPPAGREPVRRDDHRHVEPVHQAHAVLGQPARPAHAHLGHRQRRPVASRAPSMNFFLLLVPCFCAASAGRDPARPRARRERQRGQARAAAVQPAQWLAVGDQGDGEARVGGDERPHRERAQVVQCQVRRRRRRLIGCCNSHGDQHQHHHLAIYYY